MTAAPRGGVLVPLGSTPWTTKGQYLLRHGDMTVGRAPECDIHLPMPAVSRLHAELRWQDDRLILEHRSHTNATVVNGCPITRRVELKSGDIVEIADCVWFRVELFGTGDEDPTEPHPLADRRMCAVLVADVAGYSNLMEQAESETVAHLRDCFKIFERQVAEAGGRLQNVAGDGVLAVFSSVVSGIRCAVEIQQQLRVAEQAWPEERRMRFRMGLNAGDVVFDAASGLHGDAVNVAARLEKLAPPGEIYVSGAVVDLVHDLERDRFRVVRDEQLKNISRPIRIYQVKRG